MSITYLPHNIFTYLNISKCYFYLADSFIDKFYKLRNEKMRLSFAKKYRVCDKFAVNR